MTDFLYQLIANHGTTALAWVLTLLGGLLAKYVWHRISNSYARGVVERAWTEVRTAVMEIAQTYAGSIKKGREDGKLTSQEKGKAQMLAIETAKRNIGPKGLRRLARILGIDSVDDWIRNKVEATVHELSPDATAVLVPPSA
ncbi:MAG TPA: hypothetical protein VFG83_16855 [Kofleriaceae bacterium]|nr:hypothetical protein [Kofleriaceae bacterium]